MDVKNPNRQTLLASLGAVTAALAATSCCLPLLPFVAAAGLAGSSAIFVRFQPYLLGLAVLLIGYGFFQAHRAKKCNRKPGLLNTLVLWASAAIVITMILFPQAVALLFAESPL